MKPVKIALLTGGGDCPGLNAVIRAVVRKGQLSYGDQLVGFTDGWRGALENTHISLDVARCRGILPRGGTMLGSSRTNPARVPGGMERVIANVEKLGIDGIIPIGGDDTLSVAHALAGMGVRVVGVPKTIDNDLRGTEVTFGFHTAVQTATDAIDRLHTTAESHDRVIVCEVMGRHAGWIALYAGIAGGAAEIVIPEEPFDVAAICHRLTERHQKGRYASVVVIAEGAVPKGGTLTTASRELDQFGHVRLGGIGAALAEEIERITGMEARVTTLGHIQRGGTPTAFDRVLATRFGIAAIDAMHRDETDVMVALVAGEIVTVPFEVALSSPKTVDPALLHEVAEMFFS